MTQTYEWTFANNEEGVIEGPRHPGMVTFEGDRATTVIREAIQNSLDARRQGKQPVLVDFQKTYLSRDLLAADSLTQSFQHAIESSHNNQEFRSIFEKAQLFLRGGGASGRSSLYN